VAVTSHQVEFVHNPIRLKGMMVWLKSSHLTGNYLGGVRLHLTGCGGEDRTQLRLICRHGNALVHTTLGPQLRYIVVRILGPLSCSQSSLKIPLHFCGETSARAQGNAAVHVCW